MSKRIGVLTGGGDTPALNATLKGIALEAEELGYELIGFMEGWAGVLTGGSYVRLNPDMVDENRGGTLLQSSRTNLRASNKLGEAVDNLKNELANKNLKNNNGNDDDTEVLFFQ